MRVSIIGWYGTETIGDRAILAGIFSFLLQANPTIEILLGSLYPFFSERTLAEDQLLWEQLANTHVPVELFDSSNPNALRKAVRSSDLVLIGGGPLMDLREMHMLAYAFRYARSNKIKTGIFGCGIGPLNKKEYRKIAGEVLLNADFIILRDSLSKTAAQQLVRKDDLACVAAIDPAAYCAQLFRSVSEVATIEKRILVNMRSMPTEFGEAGAASKFQDFAVALVKKIHDENEKHKVLLIPNHNFFFGGDDRTFLNTIKFRIGDRDIRVQNRPLSLQDTMQTFAASSFCIGMRFHSMLLMTLLNGHCRILNYTGKSEGKISGFLNDFDPEGFFNSGRMVSLDSDILNLSPFQNLFEDERFEPPLKLLDRAFETYRSVLSEIL